MSTPLRLPFIHLENFGHSLASPSFIARPTTIEEIAAIFKLARQTDLTVTARGAGRSYNDAALNGGGIVLDMRHMDQVTAWDPLTGIITLQPGVTLQSLWEKVLPDGWWVPVVSGTMTTTLGGCLGSNIHGKNNFRMGTIGDHVIEFKALLPTGAEITCTPSKNGDLFRAMIGGFGLLGIFTSITLQMKPMQSGLLEVSAWQVPDLESHLQALQTGASQSDYIVGWMDVTARGKGLGRGQIHAARYLKAEEDPQAATTRQVTYQTLPDRFFGLVPRSLLPSLMTPFMNDTGVRLVNLVKFYFSRRSRTYRQSHAAFHFLLDYIPAWERAYGHLIQYQSFLPEANTRQAWKKMLTLSAGLGMPAYLGVTKRHRPDGFLLSHGVDGYSLAMDFRVTSKNHSRLSKMLAEFDRIVLNAGGRFYFAKNSETSAASARDFLGDQTLEKFRRLKKRCDPHLLLQSDLYRRIFG